ncbi:unnamed protein product [Protopolystoma xenopodis]|uniref:Uncharacterized protein n=1 Tax=Protopolystoma xenopodis TaxID=117903 RepID=A0A448X219_9PLAT|nr:unnamed protein product [Protopolystoma xenopodis]
MPSMVPAKRWSFRETLWNVPSPVSSAIVLVPSSIGPLVGYTPKRFAGILVDIVSGRRHHKDRSVSW